MLVGKVQKRVEEMIQEGLKRRKGIFGFSFFPFRKSLPGRGQPQIHEERKQLKGRT